MDDKYCSSCAQKRPLSSFFKDASAGLRSRLWATCAPCRIAQEKYKTKRKALQQLDPNVPPKKRATACTRPKPSIPPPTPPESRPEATIPPPNPPELRPEATVLPSNPPESRLETPIRVPTPPPTQPQASGFLPTN